MNQLRQLLDKYEDMLGVAIKVGDNEKTALCHNYIGATLRLMGQWKESYACQLKGLEIARKLENRLPLAVALCNLGALCAEMTHFDEALEYLKESLEISIEESNPLRIASAKGTIGKILLSQGRWEEALEQFQEALRNGEAQNSLRHQMCSYTSLALTECARGGFPQAEDHLKKASRFAFAIEKELAEEPDDSGETFIDGSFSLEENLKRKRDLFVFRLAEAHYERCRQRKDLAVQKIEESLQTAISIGYRYGEIRARLEKSWCLHNVYDNMDVIKFVQETINMAEELGARLLEGEGFRVLAVLYAQSGNSGSADVAFKQALDRFSKIGDIYSSGRTYIDWGMNSISKENVDRNAAMKILKGLQSLISLSKVSEPVDVMHEYVRVFRGGLMHLEKQVSGGLERLAELQDSFAVVKSESDVQRSLNDALIFRQHILSLSSVCSIITQCSRLLSQLAPNDKGIAYPFSEMEKGLKDLGDLIYDQEQIVDNHIDLIRREVQRFELKREQERNVVLQFIQILLASFGATGIYLSILLKKVNDISTMDLGAVALTILSWGAVPFCIYRVRLRIGKVIWRIITVALVALGLALTALHLGQVVVKP